MVQEQDFQPQGRNTTNGPNVHTYIPRSDGSIVIGGIAYVPQVSTAAASTEIPVGSTAAFVGSTVPAIATTATAVPVLVPEGGEARSLVAQAPSAAQMITTPCYNPAYLQHHSYNASLSVQDSICFIYSQSHSESDNC